MALTKPAGTWAYPDLAALPDDQTRYEIIDGELFEIPSATLAHALAIMALIRLLLPVIDRLRGRFMTAPSMSSSRGRIRCSPISWCCCLRAGHGWCDAGWKAHLTC